ncbi:MAG: hypothetical protein LBF34_01180, partial [Puniceicoccales bacterium]|nr:hypothetical protein [Puniceicoccales bacterium]
MAKKLLLNLINGVLLVSFCSMGKVVGAVSRSLREKGDIDLDERKVMRGLYFEKETKSGDEK